MTRPTTGYPVDDFQTKITELFLHLSDDLGGVARVNDVLFRMFELAFPHASAAELRDFTTLQGAVRCMNVIINDSHEAITSLRLEQLEYDAIYEQKNIL